VRPVYLRWRRAGSRFDPGRAGVPRVGLALEFRGVLTVYCSINFRFRSDIIPGGLYHTSTPNRTPHTVSTTQSHRARIASPQKQNASGCHCANNSELSLQGPMSTTPQGPTDEKLHASLHTTAHPQRGKPHRRSAQARAAARPSHAHRILIYSVARPHASRTAHRIYYSITATSPRALSHRRTRHCNSTDTVTESQLRRAAAHLMFSILCVPPKARKMP